MSDERRTLALPDRLVRNVADVWGEAGNEWLDGLPALLNTLARRWSIRIGEPYPDLSYNHVAPVERADGSRAVLKVGVPDPERLAETAALPHYGSGMVRVLASDGEAGALLLERLEPGEPLSALTEAGRDEEATRIAVRVMRSLWQPVPEGLPVPTVAGWAAGLDRMRSLYGGSAGPLPADLVRQAENAFAELIPLEVPVLLHGDFHHGNILSARRLPWIAIDPKGLTGPRGYDAGNFLRSNLETLPDPQEALERRLGILADELGMERDILRRWSLAQAVLSAWWSIEDHGGGWQGTIETARLLAQMGP